MIRTERITTLAAGILLATCTAAAAGDTIPAWKQGTSAGIGLGGLTYFGDVGIGTRKDLSPPSGYRPALGLHARRRLRDDLSLSAALLYGSLEKSERSLVRNLNFNTRLLQLDVQLAYHTDNGRLLPRDMKFAPWVSAGLGVIRFDPRGDLYDAAGRKYHYWSDGTVRDTEELPVLFPQGNIIVRDHRYETRLDSMGAHANLALSVPLALGLNIKLAGPLQLHVAGQFQFTLTDYLDDFSHEDRLLRGNDMFFGLSASLHYLLDGGAGEGFGDDAPPELAWSDEDGDGVHDFHDRCPGTAAGIAAGADGCPADSDRDGVPDHRDREPATPAGKPVNNEGVQVSKQDIAALHRAYMNLSPTVGGADDGGAQVLRSIHPSLISFRVEIIELTGSITEAEKELYGSIPGVKITANADSIIYTAGTYSDIEEAEARRKELAGMGFGNTAVIMYVEDKAEKKLIGGGSTALPSAVSKADADGDGYLSAGEVQKAIDSFLDGASGLTSKDVQAIIEYFLDQ